MSIFAETNCLILVNPRGGVEDVAAMKAAGFGAIFCNILDHEPSEWDFIRQRAKEAGVVCGPKMRMGEGVGQFHPERLDYLIEVADDWNSPLIVNAESEIKGTGDVATKLIAEKVGTRDAAVSVECQPFANVEWYHIGHLPVLLQIYPQEVELAKAPFDRKAEWHAYGVKCVYFTFGTYWGATAEWYDLKSPYQLFTADAVNGDYDNWAAESDGFQACMEELMAQIGTQHGITGFMKWLRQQEGVQQRGPGYKEEDLATWPWPDKLERTLNLLREGHDAK